jgi:hypothetical protein
MLPVEELARLIDEERRRRTVRRAGERAVRRGSRVPHNLRTLFAWLGGRGREGS